MGEDSGQPPHDSAGHLIFGNGGQLLNTNFQQESAIGIFLNVVLFKPRSIRASRFLLFSISEDDLWDHFTMDAVLRRITWSLNALYDGQHPSKDPWERELPERLKRLAGQSITHDRLRFVITEIRRDWSWHKKIWRFYRTSWNGIQMCHWCRALAAGDRGDLYWNFSDTSSWKNNIFSTDEFMEERIPPNGICFLATQARFQPNAH